MPALRFGFGPALGPRNRSPVTLHEGGDAPLCKTSWARPLGQEAYVAASRTFTPPKHASAEVTDRCGQARNNARLQPRWQCCATWDPRAGRQRLVWRCTQPKSEPRARLCRLPSAMQHSCRLPVRPAASTAWGVGVPMWRARLLILPSAAWPISSLPIRPWLWKRRGQGASRLAGRGAHTGRTSTRRLLTRCGCELSVKLCHTLGIGALLSALAHRGRPRPHAYLAIAPSRRAPLPSSRLLPCCSEDRASLDACSTTRARLCPVIRPLHPHLP